MARSARQVVTFIALGCLAMSAGGCALLAGAAVGAGGVAYMEGKFQENLRSDPPKIATATEKAFAALGITPDTKSGSGLEAKVTGHTSEKQSVTVDIKNQGSGISQVSIRFGVFGDEAKSRALMDEIKKNL